MRTLKIIVSVVVIALGVWLHSSCRQDNEAVNDPASEGSSGTQKAFSYDAYEDVLTRFVNEEGTVDYAALKQDRDRLDQFARQLEELASHSYETWSSAEQLAFWINAYNALTLKVIIDHYPIKAGLLRSLVYPRNSIRQIPGVWDQLKFTVLGRSLTLGAIEHEIIRQEFQEPRIHMALVCAAIGCPPLRREPYRGEILDGQLAEQTRGFLADPDKFRIDHDSGTVYLSSIFDWFKEDFLNQYEPENGFDVKGTGAADRAVLNFVSSYLPTGDAEYLKHRQYEIEYLGYDWSLNEQ